MPLQRLFEMEPTIQVKGSAGRTLSCVSCGLFKGVLTPRMPPYGKCRRGVALVGEAPGQAEDRSGKPWQGRAGRTLQEALQSFDFDLARDCVSFNSANCRPPKNRAPTPHEMACCRVKIVKPAMLEYKPKVAILFGGSPTASVIGSVYSGGDDKIGKWRGLAIPVPEWNCWVCPTYHPSYINREEHRKEIKTVWLQDIERALGMLDEPVPPPENLRDYVKILNTDDEIIAALERARQRRWFSFDYETTGLKAIIQKPVCASFAQSPNRAYAFMFRGSKRVNKAWKEVLEDDKVLKISHNLKFEQEWSQVHFDVHSIKWAWDGMLGAHVIDNRPGICGLKHQAFVNFGIIPWDDAISKYLESIDSRNPAAPNRIYEFIERYGEEEALIYCGLDSLIELRLALRQMGIIDAAS